MSYIASQCFDVPSLNYASLYESTLQVNYRTEPQVSPTKLSSSKNTVQMRLMAVKVNIESFQNQL